jgi:hypothetical protein
VSVGRRGIKYWSTYRWPGIMISGSLVLILTGYAGLTLLWELAIRLNGAPRTATYWERNTEEFDSTTWFTFGDKVVVSQHSLGAYVLFFASLVVNALLFCLAVLSTASIYEILCTYQPWIALAEGTQPAYKSVTLDYGASWFPVGRALRNRHWFIAWLAAWQFVATLFPPVQVSLFRGKEQLFWRKLEYEEVKGGRFTWKERLDSKPSPDVFRQALASLPNKILSNQAWPMWSSSDSMLLPLDLKGKRHDSHHDFEEFETVALRPRLEYRSVRPGRHAPDAFHIGSSARGS